MNNSWIILIMAGICEVVWALGLKYSNGFSKMIPSVFTILFMVISTYLLAIAIRQIPIGTSYSIWVGIGAIGAFIGGALLFHDKVHVIQIVSLALIVVGIIGLKLFSVE